MQIRFEIRSATTGFSTRIKGIATGRTARNTSNPLATAPKISSLVMRTRCGVEFLTFSSTHR